MLKIAFSNLPDNLKGTYYALGELTGEQEDTLQAGGFLFQKPGLPMLTFSKIANKTGPRKHSKQKASGMVINETGGRWLDS